MKFVYELKDIWFRYNAEHPLFCGLSCKIKENIITGIIGPNGAGKTSLLNILAGLLKPTKGEVIFNERLIEDYERKEIAQRIGILFSEYQFIYNYNVWEFVLMGRYPYIKGLAGFSEKDFKSAERAMRITDTIKLKSKGIQELSSGEKQLVLLAHILTQEPEVLLLDEPFSHLDLKHQIKVINILKEINKTIIFVTHNIMFVKQIADEAILLKNGKPIAQGTPKNILTRRNIANLFGIKKDGIKINKSVEKFKKSTILK